MPHTSEREVLIDLIGMVRSPAEQTLTLHLQLGAVRTLLARKGAISEIEFSAVLRELDALTSVDEIVSRDRNVDEVFDGLLRRLEGAD